jgi:predicted N-acetyltransferase YhbS
MITTRELLREEIEQIWGIDRGEVIENIYYFENGTLVLKPEHFEAQGWPPGEAQKYTPILYDCFDRGGWFCGAYEEAKLIGAAILESKFIGKSKEKLQLKFLHVSKAYRNKGLGKQLFELARVTARQRGARRMYISATPSENTVNFYLRLGSAVTDEPDPELFAFEPEDIHLECDV